MHELNVDTHTPKVRNTIFTFVIVTTRTTASIATTTTTASSVTTGTATIATTVASASISTTITASISTPITTAATVTTATLVTTYKTDKETGSLDKMWSPSKLSLWRNISWVFMADFRSLATHMVSNQSTYSQWVCARPRGPWLFHSFLDFCLFDSSPSEEIMGTSNNRIFTYAATADISLHNSMWPLNFNNQWTCTCW